jgi:hypothetical protein
MKNWETAEEVLTALEILEQKMASEAITYDKADLRAITRAFKAMDDEAATQAKEKSGALVEFLRGKIISAAGGLKNNKAATRIAQGSKVAKSSKIGEINLGYASQKFTGGGTTQINQGTEGGNWYFSRNRIWI